MHVIYINFTYESNLWLGPCRIVFTSDYAQIFLQKGKNNNKATIHRNWNKREIIQLMFQINNCKQISID